RAKKHFKLTDVLLSHVRGRGTKETSRQTDSSAIGVQDHVHLMTNGRLAASIGAFFVIEYHDGSYSNRGKHHSPTHPTLGVPNSLPGCPQDRLPVYLPILRILPTEASFTERINIGALGPQAAPQADGQVGVIEEPIIKHGTAVERFQRTARG